MNQCEMVVEYIRDNGGITAKEAMTELGIMRLASRIHDLKEAGYAFETENVKVRNRYGETCTVTRYKFKGEENEQG